MYWCEETKDIVVVLLDQNIHSALECSKKPLELLCHIWKATEAPLG